MLKLFSDMADKGGPSGKPQVKGVGDEQKGEMKGAEEEKDTAEKKETQEKKETEEKKETVGNQETGEKKEGVLDPSSHVLTSTEMKEGDSKKILTTPTGATTGVDITPAKAAEQLQMDALPELVRLGRMSEPKNLTNCFGCCSVV